MKKLSLASALVLASAALFCGQSMRAADVENYKRSSIYTILLHSSAQDARIEKETNAETEGSALVSMFSKNAGTKENVSYAKLVREAFSKIAIPSQFNDHNLDARLLDFDATLKGVTADDRSYAESISPKKKSGGFGKMLGAIAKESVGIDSNDPNAEVEENAIPVLVSFMRKNNIPANLLAKWFDYGKDAAQPWSMNTILERGKYALTDDKLKAAQIEGSATGIYSKIGRQLVENTYVIALNLRFRSNQAIAQEASKVAGGLLGSNAGKLTSLAGGLIAGKGFQVQAKAYLFRLKWNNELEVKFHDEIMGKNASLDDLIKSGICELEYIGTEKEGSRVRMSLTNKTPQSQLIQYATENAIDKAIAKLQVKNEVFRTAFPISEVDGEGHVYAKVGMKEGIEKGDEYEILEQQEDKKTGDIIWKSIGKVKAVKDQIWDNTAGAAEQLAEDQSDKDADKKELASADAINLGKTCFEGAKKGQDYSGYYVRLKKKK